MSTYRKEWDCCGDVTETDSWEPEVCPFCTPVYTASQPTRQPLTDEELDAMWGEDDYPSLRFFMLAARAVERKHGIGGKP